MVASMEHTALNGQNRLIQTGATTFYVLIKCRTFSYAHWKRKQSFSQTTYVPWTDTRTVTISNNITK